MIYLLILMTKQNFIFLRNRKFILLRRVLPRSSPSPPLPLLYYLLLIHQYRYSIDIFTNISYVLMTKQKFIFLRNRKFIPLRRVCPPPPSPPLPTILTFVLFIHVLRVRKAFLGEIGLDRSI